jgi:hypothetical protein
MIDPLPQDDPICEGTLCTEGLHCKKQTLSLLPSQSRLTDPAKNIILVELEVRDRRKPSYYFRREANFPTRVNISLKHSTSTPSPLASSIFSPP